MPTEITALSGDQPHADYGGWANFLADRCEITDQCDGVTLYTVCNQNFIVFPDGTLIQNFAYHGHALMAEVHAYGAAHTLATILDDHYRLAAATSNLCNALDRLTDSLEAARKVQMAV